MFAAPGSPLDPRAEGTNDLLSEGAKICARADDVLTALAPRDPADLFAALEQDGREGEPLWGEQALLGVDPQTTPRRAPGDEFDEAAARPSRRRPAEAARDRIDALLGPRRSRSTISRARPSLDVARCAWR